MMLRSTIPCVTRSSLVFGLVMGLMSTTCDAPDAAPSQAATGTKSHALPASPSTNAQLVCERGDPKGLGKPDLGTPAGLLAWMVEHPDQVGFALMRTDQSKPLIELNEGDPFGLASVHKVMILSAYARAITAGRLNPAERVPIARIERWYWPGTDGGAHPAALEDWHDRGVSRGDGANETVPLDEVAYAMIRWSDNAATDYLLRATGGPHVVLESARRSGYEGELAPPSLFGMFVMEATSPDAWRRATPTEQVVLADRAAEATTASEVLSLRLPRVDVQAELSASTFLGRPLEWVRFMVAIEREIHDRTDEGVILERALGWPMQFSSNKYTFTEFGTKGGNLPSIVTEASYVATSEDDRTAVVLFLRDLSQADSNKLLSSFAHQSFMTKAATDPSFTAKICRALGKPT